MHHSGCDPVSLQAPSRRRCSRSGEKAVDQAVSRVMSSGETFPLRAPVSCSIPNRSSAAFDCPSIPEYEIPAYFAIGEVAVPTSRVRVDLRSFGLPCFQAPVKPAVIAASRRSKGRQHGRLPSVSSGRLAGLDTIFQWRIREPLRFVAAEPGKFRGQRRVVLLSDRKHRAVP